MTSPSDRYAHLRPKPGQAPANKGRKFPAEPLTEAEVNALIAGCSPTSMTGVRNRALITVMYRGGLRIAEALALKPADVDPVGGTIRVLLGKGKRARTIGFDPGAMAVVQRWIDMRRQLGLNGRPPLFCTLQGKPLHQQYVRTALQRLAAAANVEKRVHPHGLRHTHASELAAEGKPINVISAQLGHSGSGVTARYVDHLAPAVVIATMQQREWTAPPARPRKRKGAG
jgi:site-specific recombinase XerD